MEEFTLTKHGQKIDIIVGNYYISAYKRKNKKILFSIPKRILFNRLREVESGVFKCVEDIFFEVTEDKSLSLNYKKKGYEERINLDFIFDYHKFLRSRMEQKNIMEEQDYYPVLFEESYLEYQNDNNER